MSPNRPTSKLDALISRGFMALITIVLGLASSFLRDLNTSVGDLNVKMAVMVEKLVQQQAMNQQFDSRLARLEELARQKDSRSRKE